MPHKDFEARRAYFHAYRLAHLEHIIAKDRTYYKANRDKMLASNKTWRDAHPGYNTEHGRAWRKANPEKQKALVLRYRKRCNQLQNNRKRKLRQTAPDLVRIMDKVYKYRRKALGIISKADIEFVIIRDNWRCGICHRRVAQKHFTIDHILPITCGGDNSRANLRLAHFRCNASRQDTGIAQLRLLE